MENIDDREKEFSEILKGRKIVKALLSGTEILLELDDGRVFEYGTIPYTYWEIYASWEAYRKEEYGEDEEEEYEEDE